MSDLLKRLWPSGIPVESFKCAQEIMELQQLAGGAIPAAVAAVRAAPVARAVPQTPQAPAPMAAARTRGKQSAPGRPNIDETLDKLYTVGPSNSHELADVFGDHELRVPICAQLGGAKDRGLTECITDATNLLQYRLSPKGRARVEANRAQTVIPGLAPTPKPECPAPSRVRRVRKTDPRYERMNVEDRLELLLGILANGPTTSVKAAPQLACSAKTASALLLKLFEQKLVTRVEEEGVDTKPGYLPRWVYSLATPSASEG